jgi:hypothetical protein
METSRGGKSNRGRQEPDTAQVREKSRVKKGVAETLKGRRRGDPLREQASNAADGKQQQTQQETFFSLSRWGS